MDREIDYTPAERLALTSIAGLGLVGVNGAFLYGLLLEPALLGAALRNPVSLAFVVEAFVLMGMLAYLLGRWGVARLRWPWFVTLSLLGSMAFALPVAILWPYRTRGDRASETRHTDTQPGDPR
jgi:hypothetical protein